LRDAACTTPDMCSSETTPARAAVSASILPRCAATGSCSERASSMSGFNKVGVILV